MFTNLLSAYPNDLPKIINYIGIDLIKDSKTNNFINEWYASSKIKNSTNLNIKIISNDISNNIDYLNNCADLVIAWGSLHHTPDVNNALIQTFKYTKKNGYYLGWINNEYKKLRELTTNFLRDEVKLLNEDEKLNEIKELSKILAEIGRITKGHEIEIKNKIHSIDLDPGKYDLQQILFDYFIRCYYSEIENSDELFDNYYDFLAPNIYIGTTKSEIKNYIKNLGNIKNTQIVNKINGHSFLINN